MVSLVVLLWASDKFIESAEKIGLSFGISPFIIGVTIVAFGTSLPELATSIVSVFSGTSEIVTGNVIGSNITNILLVFGVTAIIDKEMRLDFDIVNTDMPILITSALMLYFIVYDGQVTLFEGILFLLGLVVFLYNSFSSEREELEDRPSVNFRQYILLLIGALLVYFSAKYTIYAIEKISAIAEIPADIIALTGVALGTSLPELIVSIAAAKKGKHAIAVGNVLGSNLFNTFAVMGIPRLFGDLKITEITTSFTSLFMLAVTILFFFVTLSKRISRMEGFLLILLYLFFIGHLVHTGL